MSKVLDVYCRISQDYDGTLRSVESQEEDCRDAIDENHPGWAVGMVHRDHAKSAWNPTVVREEWNALMARLESGEADGVMVYDLTRFTRKPIEGERLLALAARGVIVASLTTTYNLRTADGRKQFRDAMTAAAHESDKISERSSRGKRKKAKRGKSNASHRGFARDGFLPNPVGWEVGDPRTPVAPEQLAREQAAVRDAAARLLAGESLARIAGEWNAAGLFTVTGKRWDGALVRQLLEAPSLAGLAVHNGVVVGELSGVHALDRETWDALQSHFTSRKRGRPASAYLLSGIVECGRCGRPLYGRPQTSRNPYPDGSVARGYHCMSRVKEGGCGALTIDQRFADDAVTEAVLAVLGDPRHADRLARRAAKVEEARTALVLELQRLEGDAEALASKVASWGFARVNAAMEPMEARMAEVREQLAGMDSPDETAGVDAALAWDDATLAQQRAMVKRAFPDGIAIRPATSRGKASLTADRFDFAPAAGPDRGPDREGASEAA
jgi:DNA invertase Pin-like site-specific DNA recombinase